MGESIPINYTKELLPAKVAICCPIPTKVGDNRTESDAGQGENVCYNLVNFAAEL